MRKSLSVSLVFLLVLSCFLAVRISPVSATGEGWLSGYGYRQGHVITHAAGSGTGYQMRYDVFKAAGSSSGSSIYLNTHCRDDFADIRFTRDDGSTLLDHFMESVVSGTSAIFWVEVSDDLSSVDQTIYVYYDNAAASSGSSGSATFPILFEDFESYSLGNLDGQDGWTPYGGDVNRWQVVNDVVFSGSKGAKHPPSLSLEENIYRNFVSTFIDGKIILHGRKSATNSAYPQFRICKASAPNTDIYGLSIFQNTGYFQAYHGGFVNVAAYSADTWYSVEMQFRSDTHQDRYRLDYGSFISWGSPYSSWVLGSIGAIGMDGSKANTEYIDLIFCAKLATGGADPADSTWQSEESSSLPLYDVTKIDVNTTLTVREWLFYSFWYIAAGELDGFIFSYNDTGSFVNDTWVEFAAVNNSWANVSKSISHDVGIVISWRIYANGTAGWNVLMPLQNETITALLTFYFNDHGAFLKNGTCLSNQSSVTYSTLTPHILLEAVPDWNYTLGNFTISGSAILINRLNFTVQNCSDVWCWFDVASGGGFDEALQLSAGVAAVFILIPVCIVVFIIIWGRRKG